MQRYITGLMATLLVVVQPAEAALFGSEFGSPIGVSDQVLRDMDATNEYLGAARLWAYTGNTTWAVSERGNGILIATTTVSGSANAASQQSMEVKDLFRHWCHHHGGHVEVAGPARSCRTAQEYLGALRYSLTIGRGEIAVEMVHYGPAQVEAAMRAERLPHPKLSDRNETDGGDRFPPEVGRAANVPEPVIHTPAKSLQDLINN